MRKWLWFTALVVVLAIVGYFFFTTASDKPFAYDESDYMYAGSRGLLANYFDQPSQSLAEFIRMGLALKNNPALRQGTSEYIRNVGDVAFYRHYHGPVYAMWIALLGNLGVRTEAEFRASGLILHAGIAFALFWGFLAIFPEWPTWAAFTAGAFYALNRTAINAATIITQHEPFAAAACLSLLLLGAYVRTRKPGYWYATAAALGAAFATVEISLLLDATAIVVVVVMHGTQAWRVALRLILKGTAVFAVATTLVWPKSLLMGGAIKGYLYLAYIAIARKTFSPIGPMELWGFKLKTYPWEFVPAVVCVVVLGVFFRRVKAKQTVLPFLIYATFFFMATTVITVSYTYYHCSLFVAVAMLAGVACGLVSQSRVGGLLPIALLASQAVEAWFFYGEQSKSLLEPIADTDVVAYFHNRAGSAMVPYIHVPQLHYYSPNLKTVGYDTDWTMDRVSRTIAKLGPVDLICAESQCRAFEAGLPNGWIQGQERISRNAKPEMWVLRTNPNKD